MSVLSSAVTVLVQTQFRETLLSEPRSEQLLSCSTICIIYISMSPCFPFRAATIPFYFHNDATEKNKLVDQEAPPYPFDFTIDLCCVPLAPGLVFFRNYITLVNLAFLNCFVVQNKLNWKKMFTSNWDLTCNPRIVASLVFTLSCRDNCANLPLFVRVRL